jgi:hypothetical protein
MCKIRIYKKGMRLFGHGGGVLLKGHIQVGTEMFGESKAKDEFD